MPSSCKEIRDALAQCLQQSDCVMVQRHTAAECLREPLVDTLPKQCLQLRKGLGDCKRGLVDMRKRFRGNVPVSMQTLQAADQGQGYQLYGGRPAFASPAKHTDGREEEVDWREAEAQTKAQTSPNSTSKS